MKTSGVFIIISLLLACQLVYATDTELKQVVVYRQGAKITQTANISVPQGNSEFILDNLTVAIDPNSLQVSTRGDAILLSASVRTNFMGYKTLPKRTKQLEDSLQLLNDRIDWIGNEQAVYQGEEKLIIDNQKIVNEKEKITTTDLLQLADFYRNRLTAVRKKYFENNIELRELREKKIQIEQQLQEINYQKGQQMGEVVLSFSAEQATRVNISISYLTTNAGWSPIYDIRCSGTSKPLDLLYKANVYQTTGYDWNGVDLIISTGNPTANNDRPVLNPWYIDFMQMAVVGYGAEKRSGGMPGAAMNMYMEADASMDLKEEVAAPVPYQVVETTNQMAVEYEIKIKQNIPTDGKEHIVPISSFELPAVYTYHSVPKLDPHAFLLAKVADYNQFNLLPGQTNIFFEGMYVGQTYLNPEVISDSLVVSMGRDDRINVKREILKDFTSSKVIGSNKKETKGYELIIRNNKTIPVSIEILDQVPLSQNKEIEVEIEEMSGAQYIADYGRLLWKYDLTPGETRKIRFIYSVKYPKDKQVNGI
jgi:uncharacterized protein (TIGR02231 family)